MFATLQMLVALGLGRSALVADLVLTGAAVAAGVVVVARSRRQSASGKSSVVAEAEAVVDAAPDRQPA